MLIGVCFFVVNVVLPQILNLIKALVQPVVLIVIVLAGIVMIFGAVGLKISNNLGSTIVNNISKGISNLVRNIGKAIKWIFKLIPIVFLTFKKQFRRYGMGDFASDLLAILVVLIFI